ncbi:hypothetical protein [Neochlamydia sp. AcF84]|uniref:hypothetical protein n=1 Tax=Neochlamydia sp. AcF84 TaxID=2315858 RepID=UPI001407D4C9|nr:hypothetical protein [Neochlamydia sp. AcF84]
MGVEKSEAAPSATAAEAMNTSSSTTPSSMGASPQNSERFATISSMSDLKEKAPEMHKAMMQGLAMNICNSMQKHQQRFKEILRKGRSQQ